MIRCRFEHLSLLYEADWIDGPERLVPLVKLEASSGLIVEYPAPEAFNSVAGILSRLFRVSCDGSNRFSF
jgi:hypothetical protein